MNIFYVDSDPIIAAQNLVDRHVVKMILESAQLLCTAHRVLDGREIVTYTKNNRRQKYWLIESDNRETILYKATHVNHPSAVWARTSVENYNWLFDHFHALGNEYTFRYGKKHKCLRGEMPLLLSAPPHKLRDFDFTTPPSAMAPEYIVSEDPVQNYRNYYKNGKSRLHQWTSRTPPSWM